MPFPAERLYSLTHVRYTPHRSWVDGSEPEALDSPSRWKHMVADAQRFLPCLVGADYRKSLFAVFSAIMAVAAIVAAIAFPAGVAREENLIADVSHLSRAVWFGVAGVSCMALTQAMMFSFIERIGVDRGYGTEAVTGVLIALGFVNLLPAPLAAILEKKLSARIVLLVGPVCQAVIAVTITFGSGLLAYAIPTALFAAVMIFTHTFAFGLLSRLDPTARALAGTPAMLMIGAAVGPILGGTLVQSFGYQALGLCAIAISTVAVLLFSRVFATSARVAGRQSLEVA